MSFREEWFHPLSQQTLAKLAEETERLHGAVIEVGSWEGRSTVALANALPGNLYAVDTWEGSPGEISAELAAEPGRDVYATFQENIKSLTRGNVTVCRMGWREFFEDWDEPIRLLFIDAEHTYTEVQQNIQAALPHMVPGGIICGDDVLHPPVAAAVMDTLGNAKVQASLWIWRKP